MRRFALMACAAVAMLPRPATAQPERYDVGRKLINFETAWDGQPDAASRKRAIPPLKSAMAAFFGGRFSEAGRSLDNARHALAESAPGPADIWADAVVSRPVRRAVDPGRGPLTVHWVALYKRPTEGPANAEVRLTVTRADGTPLRPAITTPVANLPVEQSVDLAGLPEGDHRLLAEVIVTGRIASRQVHVLSVISNLSERQDAARVAISARENATTEELTATSHLRMLAQGGLGETGFPCHRLLGEVEAVARQPGAVYFSAARTGEFWLTINAKGAPVDSRLFVPEDLNSRPVPLVVALHGAGGTENLFFDAYGHGEVVRQCRQRGWLLVATRSVGFFGPPPVGEVVSELAKRYPVDLKRVYLVGHSMGAGQAVALARSAPDRWAGVAALGGGGRVISSDAIKKVPFFVGCGTEDFALGGSRTLVKSLRDAGVEKLYAKEYSDIEHIVIVQAALPDVFRWYDEVGGR